MTEASQTEQSISENMPDFLAATGSSCGSIDAIEKLKSGNFRDADGALFLRLEDSEVTNGPDLHVILSTHDDPQGGNDVHQEGCLDIGELKSNIGNRNCATPAGTDESALKAAGIYCQPFHVIFSVAALQ